MRPIIELAKEAGFAASTAGHYIEVIGDDKDLERFAALVRAERQWVDLTDDEVNEIVHEKVMDMRMTYKDLVRAVIAAFKEKNK